MSWDAVIWPGGRGLWRLVHAASDAVASALGAKNTEPDRLEYAEFLALEKSGAAEAIIILPKSGAYYDRFDARTNETRDHERILLNELARLHPEPASEAITLARAAKDDASRIDLLIIRQETMTRLEAHAGDIGMRALNLASDEAPDIIFASAMTAAQSARDVRVWAISMLMLLAGLWVFLSVIASRSANELELLGLERARLSALVETRQSEETRVSALQLLSETRPETKTVPARLEQWARWNEATSDEAWWQQLRLSGDEAYISGLSENAAMTLLSLSQGLPDAQVSFAEAISDEANGNQNYVIKIVRRR